MVKWYNESLPRISREFDSPWPHYDRKKPGFCPVFFCRAGESKDGLSETRESGSCAGYFQGASDYDNS